MSGFFGWLWWDVLGNGLICLLDAIFCRIGAATNHSRDS